MLTRAKTCAAIGAMALVTLVAGCGSVHGGHDSGSATTGKGSDTDAAFVNDMVPHHESAVEMARLAQTDAEHPELRRLADDIIASQEREIATMKSVEGDLRDAGSDGHMSGGDHGMEGAEALRGAKPFDRAFIDEMVPHHEGAVTMAKEELAKGENPTLRKLAEEIIGAQEREIAQMRDWRADWYGSRGAADGMQHEQGHGG